MTISRACGIFPGGPVVKNLPGSAGEGARSLVREPMCHGAAKPACRNESVRAAQSRSPREAMEAQCSQINV